MHKCKARMVDKHEMGEVVWIAVKCWLAKVADCMTGTLPARANQILKEFQLKLTVKKGRLPHKIVWEKPSEGWLKLNIDGFCRGNRDHVGVGGIIRYSNDNLKAAFSKNFEIGMNNGTKLQTLISGIRLCKEMEYQNIHIESDTELVVGWLQKNLCSSWYL